MKRFVIIGIFLVMIFSCENTYATRGCCSSHGGVDCSRKQANGNVICNDGWTGSSCSYSSMAKCQGTTSSSTNTNSNSNSNTSSNIKKEIYGCMDKSAKNYNKNATKDNGKCTYYIYGCMDKTAKNYNPVAEKDNGKCVPYVHGCTDKDALNYNEKAEKDDGSCIEKITGCMDSEALNYIEEANVDDGSCKYQEEVETNIEQKPNNTNENAEEASGIGAVALIGTGGAGYFLYKKKKR